jgi:hypothetical protein
MRCGIQRVKGIKIANDTVGHIDWRSIPKDFSLHLAYNRVFISRRNGSMS